jgi:hypothetical protein
MISPGNPPYATNLTRASTLVCDPHIQVMSKLAYAFGGVVNLISLPDEYSTSIGNIDENFMSYMIYNYATQQTGDLLGIFKHYLILSEAAGNAILTSDPNNPDDGTVPKSTLEISLTLVRATSCNAFFMKAYFSTTSGSIYRIRKQILDGSGFKIQ